MLITVQPLLVAWAVSASLNVPMCDPAVFFQFFNVLSPIP